MPDTLRVGVIGTGRMGAFHVYAHQRLDCVDLVAVADPDPAARADALRGEAAYEYSDWRRLIDDADAIDAVTIACPSELHVEAALAALDAGLHVLVEKPIATTLPDALRLRGAAIDADRKLMVGHVERFNPVVASLRSALDEGRIGRVFRAQGTRVGPLPQRIKDAGVAIDLATHDLDVMQHLLGRQVEEIYADGGRFVHASQEDMLTCLARFGGYDGDVLGLLDVNWLTPQPRRELTLVGEHGMLRADYVAQTAEVVDARPRASARSSCCRSTAQEPLLAELEAFARCVLDDTPEPVPAHDGVCALAAALAVRESATARRSVTLLDIPAPVPALEVAA